jgi:hypothetical protein
LADGRYAGLGSVADRPTERLILRIGQDGAAADTLARISGEPREESAVANTSYQFQPGFSSTAAGRWIWAGWEGR